MADPITPPAVCAAGMVCIPFLQAMGMDPVNMAAGLCGVVVVQIFLPKKDEPARDVWKIMGIGSASMIVAAWGGPVIAAFVLGALPDSWAWVKNLPTDHLKSISAGIAGGFAQPLLLRVQSMIPAKAPPVVKE